MGFAYDSELAQSKHDPPTEPIITDPVHSLLKDRRKTRQTAKMKAVLQLLPRVSHSLAALIIWLRGA
jgi:predicted pyridoxine 5'-phosphate oxidase superfamily flavin-nucleotide-binding protein